VLLGLQATLPTTWPAILAPLVACGVGAGGVWVRGWGTTWWRKACIALGFPLSLVVSGAATLPAWGWLVPLAVLLMVYPIHAWRDAPVFPTPRDALVQLSAHVPLPVGAAVLDAGCGLGHGLQALHRAYAQASLTGLERSHPLRWWCALRCPWAQVQQGDMWQHPWKAYALVYVFQRPESMARVYAKAQADMVPGAWLVSLDFAVPDVAPTEQWQSPDGRWLWAYRL
jgi:hypothetical protein